MSLLKCPYNDNLKEYIIPNNTWIEPIFENVLYKFKCKNIKELINSRKILAKITPFRAAMAAGDPNGTKNAAPTPLLPSASQVQAPRVQGTQNNPGGIKYGSQAGGSFYTGNPKYVYDGSDYTRYKHLKAVNQTYDDSSFGGANNGAYVFLKRVRRF